MVVETNITSQLLLGIRGLVYDRKKDLYIFEDKEYKLKEISAGGKYGRYNVFFINTQEPTDIVTCSVTNGTHLVKYDGFNKTDVKISEKVFQNLYYQIRTKLKRKANRKYKHKICIMCGKEFTTTRSRVKCCCQECQREYASLSRKKEPVLKHHTCPNCGKEFTTYRHGVKFCSPECRVAFNKEVERKKKGYTKKELTGNPKTHTKKCPECGKVFTTYNKRRIYCSVTCSYKKALREMKKKRECNVELR